MSHEQSETIQNASGKWINVYGKALPNAGQQLPNTPEFSTVEEAVEAAKARSASFDDHAETAAQPATPRARPQSNTPKSKLSPEQASLVFQKAQDNGVSDPRILFAILRAEGGKPGMEFNYGIELGPDGVSVPAKYAGFERQAGNAAFTVKKVEGLYQQERGESPLDEGGLYKPEFIKYLSHGGGDASAWDGYAPTKDRRDTAGLNFNHAKNVLFAYADITQDKPLMPETPAKAEPNTPGKTPLDEYGKARMREQEYGEISVVTGRQEAKAVGDMHNAVMNADRSEGKTSTTSAWDYAMMPVHAVLDGLHYASSRFKGILAGKKLGEPATAEELTGLKNETTLPPDLFEKIQGSNIFMGMAHLMGAMPNRTINTLVDIVADPFLAAGGLAAGARGSSRLLRGAKELFKEEKAAPSVAGQEAPLEVPEVTVTPANAAKEPAVPNPSGASSEVIDTTGGVVSGEVPAHVKAILGKETPTPEETAVLKEFKQSQEAKLGLAKTQDKIAQERVPVRDPKTGRMMKRAALQEEAAAANASAPLVKPPTPEWSGEGVQLTLRGFGKRGKESKLTEASTPEEVAAMNEVPDPNQLELALNKIVGVDEIFAEARAHIAKATLGDDAVNAIVAQRLDARKANPFAIIHDKRGEVSEQVLVAEESAIHKGLLDRHAKTVESYLANPSDELAEKMLAELAWVSKVSRSIWANDAERAAATRQLRTGQSPVVTAFEDMVKNAPEGISVARYAEAFRLIQDGKEQAAFAKNVAGIGPVKGTMLQLLMNGLISNPTTALMNYAAGASLFGAKVMETWRMAKFADSGIAQGTAGVMAWSFLKSYIDLTVAAAKLNGRLAAKTEAQAAATARLGKEMETPLEVFKTVTDSDSAAKLGTRRSISAENYGVEDSWFSPAIDYAGHAMNIPTFMVGSSDAFLRFATTQAFMEARAFSEASRDVLAQLRTGTEMNKAQAAAAVAKRRAELMADPDAKVLVGGGAEGTEWKPLREIGQEGSDLVSMMTRLKTGTLGAKIDDATRNSLFGRAVYPFFRVGYLSGKEALVRTPILAKYVPSVAADLAAGGERAAKAHAQISTGYALAATAAVLVADGSMTGDGPSNPEMNAIWRTTHKPNTLHIPGTDYYFPYARLGPLGQVLRAVSNATYMLPRVADSEDIAAELATTTAMIYTSLITDQNMNRDLADLTASLAGRDIEGLRRWAERKSTMGLPYSAGLKSLNKQIQGELQLGDGIFEQALMLLPGYKGVPYRDLWGRIEEIPNDSAWDGLRNNAGILHKTSDPRLNKIVDRLDKDRVTFTGPSRSHEGAKLTLDEYMELRRLFGNGVKNNHGKNLPEALEELMESKEYLRGSPGPRGSRQTLLSATVAGYKQAAFAELVNQKTPDGQLVHQKFRDEYLQRKADRVFQDKTLQVGN